MSEPLNETSERFRSGRIRKMPKLVGNIPESCAKNQMKLGRNTVTISQIQRYGSVQSTPGSNAPFRRWLASA